MPTDRRRPTGDLTADLTADQVRELQRVARSTRTPSVVARRARIVLAAAAVPSTSAEQVSTATSTRWRNRYAEAGVDGLLDRPRSGRPPADLAGMHRSLLVAPLLVPTVLWTSRTIAELTGNTQSAVARAWTAAYPTTGPDLGALPAGGLRLVAAATHAGNSLLVLTAAGSAEPVHRGPFMRSPRRPALQTLLATRLLAVDRAEAAQVRADADPTEDERDAAFLTEVRRRLGSFVPLFVLACAPTEVTTASTSASPPPVIVVDPTHWQRLLGELVHRCSSSTAAELLAAQYQAMEWARSGRARFEWTVDRPGASTNPRTAGGGVHPSHRLRRGVADDVLDLVLERVASGRLAAGSPITEATLARAVHAPRGQVRDALRTLAAGGLIDHEPGLGAVVPAPHTADVIETYAARRALGTLVVRRAAHGTPGDLGPVENALQHLIEVGCTGNSWATGEADLQFQDTLATSTGMRRIPQLFRGLTDQLRLFIAVMGLDYTYSIPGMCQDDTDLLALIRARDEAGAVRVWNRKIDDATGYMTSQLAISAASRGSRRVPSSP